MFRLGRYLMVGCMTLVSSCLIVSEKDKCYEDIERGEKTGGATDPCIDFMVFASPTGNGQSSYSADNLLVNYYLSLCVATIIEQEKCQRKSNWIPTIDGRM